CSSQECFWARRTTVRWRTRLATRSHSPFLPLVHSKSNGAFLIPPTPLPQKVAGAKLLAGPEHGAQDCRGAGGGAGGGGGGDRAGYGRADRCLARTVSRPDGAGNR